MSIRGRPAATRLPKARKSTIIVTGQESTSDRIIAEWLTRLKSAHSALEPVSSTVTAPPDRARSGFARSSAARTIVLASAFAPAWMIAVCPSRESDRPGCGAMTVLMRASRCNSAVACPMTFWASRSVAICPFVSWMTTCSAVEFRPANSLPRMLRACIDWLPLSCQPAPARADSTRGAKAPKTPRITAQTTRTVRK